MGAKLGRRFLKQLAEKLKAVFVSFDAVVHNRVDTPHQEGTNKFPGWREA